MEIKEIKEILEKYLPEKESRKVYEAWQSEIEALKYMLEEERQTALEGYEQAYAIITDLRKKATANSLNGLLDSWESII